jgi:hypothetical protein
MSNLIIGVLVRFQTLCFIPWFSSRSANWDN